MLKQTQAKALMIFMNQREVLEALEDAERGKLTLALLDYLEFGTLPDFTGATKMAFIVLRKDVDQSVARWEEECARRSAAGKKGAAARAAKNFEDDVSCESDATEDNGESASSGSDQQSSSALNSLQQSSTDFNTPQDREAMPTNTNTKSNTKSNSKSNTQSKSNTLSNQRQSPTPVGAGREAEFARFWQAYPRKVGKEAARKAFFRVEVPLEQLLSALARQRGDPQWQREGGRYIPHPVTWLSQGRWEDEGASAPLDCAGFGVECL